MHQQDTEEQAMMAWETLDDSMIDKVEEENENVNETKLRMLKMMILICLVGKLKFQEIIL